MLRMGNSICHKWVNIVNGDSSKSCIRDIMPLSIYTTWQCLDSFLPFLPPTKATGGHLTDKKPLYTAFVDPEKAFDRVPRDVR